MIIADSGFWIALADKNDKHHAKADAAAKTLDEKLITSFPVMTEVCHLLLKRQGVQAQLSFMQMYQLNHPRQSRGLIIVSPSKGLITGIA